MGGRAGVQRGFVRRVWVSFIGAFLVTILTLFPFVGRAQSPQGSATDAVYLLDVTSSMVGVEGKDILNEVIDVLLSDIDRFSGGKFILITFANGPYDLDGSVGPIKAVYELDIRTDQEKLFLKQFLRPNDFKIGDKQYKGYGLFRDDSNWPGVYVKLKYSGQVVGPTGVFSAILQGLDILDRLQKEGGKDYAATHTQELFVYTDGRNNVFPPIPTFQSVLDRLKERNFQMLGQFRYKRYLFSQDLEDIKQAQEECAGIEQAGAAGYVKNVATPDISQLVILDLDRRILGFPNVWASAATGDSRTVVLKGLQIYFPPAQAKLLKGGRLVIQPVRPENFGLPGDVAIKVRTDPAELTFPLQQFDLYITLEPFSRLKAFMGQKADLKGALLFEFVKGSAAGAPAAQQRACSIATQKEPLIDFRQSSVLVDLPYTQPILQAAWSVERGEAFALRLNANDVFKAMTAEEQQVRVDYNEKQLLVTDDQGQSHKSGERFNLQGIPKLVLRVSEGLTPGHYQDSLQVTPELGEVSVNGATVFTVNYEFWVMGFDRQKLVFPNLWTKSSAIQGDARTVTLQLQLTGGPKDWGEIAIKPADFTLANSGLGIDVEPKLIEPPFDQQVIQVSLTVKPYSLLAGKEDLQAQINKNATDGYALFEFSGPTDRLLRVSPSRLPVDLTYQIYRPEITLTVNGQTSISGVLDLGAVYKDQAAFTLELEPNETFRNLAENQQQVHLDYNTGHFYLTDASGRQLPGADFNPVVTHTLMLKVNPTLLVDQAYEGAITISSNIEGLQISGQQQPFTLGYKLSRPSPQVTISCSNSSSLRTVRGGMPLGNCALEYNEVYLYEPTPTSQSSWRWLKWLRS